LYIKLDIEFDDWVDKVYDIVHSGNDTGITTEHIVAELYDSSDLRIAFENGEDAYKVADRCYSALFSSNFGIGGGEYV
jgi:hypothetical protein